MPSIPSFSPSVQFPRFGSILFPTIAPTAIVASTGTGVVTLTTAQLFQGLLPVDCQDAQSITGDFQAGSQTGLPEVAFDVHRFQQSP